MLNKLKSRKFWMAIIASVGAGIVAGLGYDVSPEQIAAIEAPLIAYILGEAYVDGKK